jgi:hypothetical protein
MRDFRILNVSIDMEDVVKHPENYPWEWYAEHLRASLDRAKEIELKIWGEAIEPPEGDPK